MKKAFKKVSRSFKKDEHSYSPSPNDDSNSIKSLDHARLHEESSHKQRNLPRETKIKRLSSSSSSKGDDFHRPSLSSASVIMSDHDMKLIEQEKMDSSHKGAPESPKENTSQRSSSVKHVSGFFKIVKRKSAKAMSVFKEVDRSPNPEMHSSKNSDDASSISSFAQLPDLKNSSSSLGASSTLDKSTSGVRVSSNDRHQDLSYPGGGLDSDTQLAKQKEQLGNLLLRFDDLDQRFLAFATAVENEVMALRKTIETLNEAQEILQYQTNDCFSDVEHKLNSCITMTQYVENQQKQQQPILNLAEFYLADLEKKWGSPFLRAVIPTLMFILVLITVMKRRLYNRFFLVPFFCFIALWILKRLIFG